jgi:hypothetical protein
MNNPRTQYVPYTGDVPVEGPKVTVNSIAAKILGWDFYRFPGTTVTVCCITLINGFNVVGESACASPDNFNKELGEKLAYNNALNKIWALEGYLLKEDLYILGKDPAP